MSELSRVTVRDEDNLRVVTVSGEVDASNADEVRGEALAELPNSSLGTILDLSALSYIDSAGIALVFELAERLSQRGQELVLVVPPSSLVRRSFEVTHVGDVAAIEPTLPAARGRILPTGDERTA